MADVALKERARHARLKLNGNGEKFVQKFSNFNNSSRSFTPFIDRGSSKAMLISE